VGQSVVERTVRKQSRQLWWAGFWRRRRPFAAFLILFGWVNFCMVGMLLVPVFCFPARWQGLVFLAWFVGMNLSAPLMCRFFDWVGGPEWPANKR
jgi:hypothetical protein